MEHCLRIHPHHNDSGGFFIAMFEKTEEFSELPLALQQKKKPETGKVRMRGLPFEVTSEDLEYVLRRRQPRLVLTKF